MSPYINWRNFVAEVKRFGRNMICSILLSFGVSLAVLFEVSCEVIIKVGVTKCAKKLYRTSNQCKREIELEKCFQNHLEYKIIFHILD